jgi:hypothetical protein
MLVEKTAEKLLGPRLIKFLHDFRRTERLSGGGGDEQAGRKIILQPSIGPIRPGVFRHRFLKIQPEKSPTVAGGVERLDHGRSIFRLCLREKRSM